MGSDTKIEWTDASWTPIRARNLTTGKIGWHCEKVSAGCKNCYAGPINRRLGTGLDYKPGHLARGDVSIFLDEKMLLAPLKWQKPRRIFVCSMTDLFADFVTDEMIDRLFAVMALCPQHTFQVLTKRPERMLAYMANVEREAIWMDAVASLLESAPGLGCTAILGRREPWLPLPNVWLGVSAEDWPTAHERIPPLLRTPAKVRFLSCEPLLGSLSLRCIPWAESDRGFVDALTGETQHPETRARYPDRYPPTARLDWVICGGESGPGARPMHPDWARILRDQCAAAGVAFHFKQWGEFAPGEIAGDYLDPDKPAKGLSFFNETWSEAWSMPDGHCDDEPDVYRIGKKRAGRLLDGVQHDGVPA